MTRTSLFCFLVVATAASTSQAQITASLSTDGQIILHGTTELIGVDLISNGGYLKTIPDGDHGDFAFLLANNPNQVTYGILGSSVAVDGELRLSAHFLPPPDVEVDFLEDVTGQWGSLGSDGRISFPGPAVPEPASSTLGLMAVAVCFGFRRVLRRR